MFILDNQNLQDLWDFENRANLTLRNGSVFFHFNRKLCLNKIDELVNFIGLHNQVDSTDISQTSNGDQVACECRTVVWKGPIIPHLAPNDHAWCKTRPQLTVFCCRN